ncbi:DUF2334 domain-containing protein [Rubrobacter xylanophilus]|uniref:DUF2334 domain-containing protein n=1 Tax=Rubrobacter xylanophilus TaxID=49319 RepID=UPI00117AD4D3|nr:DUF2334 domain-containing protein [Rubrobacter xylanophilus]
MVGWGSRVAGRLLPALLVAVLLLLTPAGVAGADEGSGTPAVLVVNQPSSEWQRASERMGLQMEMLLRHFTRETAVISPEEYEPGMASRYDRVVVVGNDALRPLPDDLLRDLARPERPVLWLGHRLEDLGGADFGFFPEGNLRPEGPIQVRYREESYPAAPGELRRIRIASPGVRVLASYELAGQEPVPYVLRGKNLWYVNGLPASSSAYPDPERDAPVLILADVLHDFLGVPAEGPRRAVVRLEDVSVHIPPERIIRIADYLHERRVPFALGVIPAQRFEDGRVVELSERPGFVRALRYAQERGGTIILHGYHHTFGSGEDYEFWDEQRDAPIAGETREMYARKLEDGIRILRDNGLEPRLWETPHYAASPLAYRTFAEYFSHAIETRDPVGWLPYPSGPDPYGQVLVPENLGYIAPREGRTVEDQLERARLLKIVRDAWAVGFYHPASVPPSELERLVEGLSRQGYVFADLKDLPTEVSYDYRPDPLTRLKSWLVSGPWLALMALDDALERQFSWWPAVRDAPWTVLAILAAAGVLLLRLRSMWRSPPPAAFLAGGSLRAWVAASAALLLLAGIAGGVRFFSGGGPSGGGELEGWSGLDWEVVYDGYGRVGVEDGAAVLEPRAVGSPSQTSAALALAGEPGWRDYTFTVRMRLEKQLRRNSPPNPWESGWLLFRYAGEGRSYYLAHKTNGLELGKLVPPAGVGQEFLVTRPEPAARPGRWHTYRIELRGPRITVYVDGERVISYTDPDPILHGRVGLYTEDARVAFRDPEVRLRGSG